MHRYVGDAQSQLQLLLNVEDLIPIQVKARKQPLGIAICRQHDEILMGTQATLGGTDAHTPAKTDRSRFVCHPILRFMELKALLRSLAISIFVVTAMGLMSALIQAKSKPFGISLLAKFGSLCGCPGVFVRLENTNVMPCCVSFPLGKFDGVFCFTDESGQEFKAYQKDVYGYLVSSLVDYEEFWIFCKKPKTWFIPIRDLHFSSRSSTMAKGQILLDLTIEKLPVYSPFSGNSTNYIQIRSETVIAPDTIDLGLAR